MEWPDDSLPHGLAGYHRRTKHAPNRYALGPAFLDWESQPDPFRRFAGARLVELPLGYDRPSPGFDELGGAPVRPLDAGTLGLFLELGLGLSAWKAVGRMHCEPTWKLTPISAEVARRAASSRDGAWSGETPNLPDRE